MSEKVYSLVIKQGSGKRVVRFVFGRWRYPSAQVYMMRQWGNEWVIHNWPLFACKLFHSHIESMLAEETSEMRKNWASCTTQVTYSLASESLHLFQHIWPMLRPFSFYHFHNYSWQGIFDVALLVQDRMSTLKRDNRRHQSSTTVKWSVFHKSHLHLITAAWHTPSGGLSPVAACRSIWICRETLAFCQTWIPYHAFSLLHLP